MPIRPENKARYPENWKQISARIRFERAGGRCECEGECGRETHGHVRCPNVHGQPAYGKTGSIVILTTAHLDHQPENCADDNLKAMCQGCHLHYDREHHAETRAETRRVAASAAGAATLLPTYTAHCFFNDGHTETSFDPDDTHALMEAHYNEKHPADIDRVLRGMR